MSKKAKKPNYSKGWETRRRNAAREVQGWAARAAPELPVNTSRHGVVAGTASPQTVGQQAGADAALSPLAVKAQLEAYHREVEAINKSNGIQIVAAFVAEMHAVKTLNRGRLPPSLVTSGLTLSYVVKALHEAGYTPYGFSPPDRREEIMDRSHSNAAISTSGVSTDAQGVGQRG
jgi:hypothetical protein